MDNLKEMDVLDWSLQSVAFSLDDLLISTCDLSIPTPNP